MYSLYDRLYNRVHNGNRDKLPDLILVMLARKKSNEEMVEELDPFLESESEKFVTWMMKLYSKLVGMTPNANKPAYLPKTTEKKRIESTDDEKGNLTEKSILEFFSGPLDFKIQVICTCSV